MKNYPNNRKRRKKNLHRIVDLLFMRIRFNVLSVSIAIVIVVAVTVSYLVFFNGSGGSQPNQTSVPIDVRYALEYFNAVNSNQTILVPSQYYSYAEQLAINGNRAVENDTEYADILLSNASASNAGFILIDMAQLNSLPYLERLSNAPNFTVIDFSTNFVSASIGSSYKNCSIAENSIDLFGICELTFDKAVLGYENVVRLPGSSSISIVNASILYNGHNSTYFPSFANSSSIGLLKGVVFAYENVTNLYLPPGLMATFYGSEMFLPYNKLSNVLDSYGEARIVSLV